MRCRRAATLRVLLSPSLPPSRTPRSAAGALVHAGHLSGACPLVGFDNLLAAFDLQRHSWAEVRHAACSRATSAQTILPPGGAAGAQAWTSRPAISSPRPHGGPDPPPPFACRHGTCAARPGLAIAARFLRPGLLGDADVKPRNAPMVRGDSRSPGCVPFDNLVLVVRRPDWRWGTGLCSSAAPAWLYRGRFTAAHPARSRCSTAAASNSGNFSGVQANAGTPSAARLAALPWS